MTRNKSCFIRQNTFSTQTNKAPRELQDIRYSHGARFSQEKLERKPDSDLNISRRLTCWPGRKPEPAKIVSYLRIDQVRHIARRQVRRREIWPVEDVDRLDAKLDLHCLRNAEIL